MSIQYKVFLRRLIKWTCVIFVCVIVLIASVWLFLQTNTGKDFIKKQVVIYLHNKLHTKVGIESIETDWLTRLKLNHFYIKDQQNVVLLVADVCHVNYDLFDILHGKLNLSFFDLQNAKINLLRNQQQKQFNFDFIVQAFASKTTSAGTTSYLFNVRKIRLQNTSVTIRDAPGGQSSDFYIGALDAVVKEMNTKDLFFKLLSFQTDSIRASVHITKRITEINDTISTIASPQIAVDKILLKNTRITYTSTNNGKISLHSLVDSFYINQLDCNLSKRNISIDEVMLKDHVSNIRYLPVAYQMKTPQDDSRTKPLTFNIKQLILNNNNFFYNNETAEEKKSNNIDYNHLAMQNCNLDLRDAGFDGKAYSGDIQQLNGKEKSGFQLSQLRAKVHYYDTGFVVKNCFAKTNNSQLNTDVRISYSSLHNILSQSRNTKVAIAIQKSQLAFDDLLYLIPILKENKNLRPWYGKTFFINTSVSGPLNKLYFPSLFIKQNLTTLSASAYVFNLPDMKRLQLQFNIQSFAGTKTGLKSLLPSSLVPDSIFSYIPETFILSGKYSLVGDNIFADGKLKSNWGNLSVRGFVKDISDKQNAKYNVAVQTQKLQLQKLLHDAHYGDATFNVQVQGRGYNLAGNKVFTTTIDEFIYNRYLYRNITASGDLQSNLLQLNVQSLDPNAIVSIDGDYNLASKGISVHSYVKNLSLYKLGFITDSFTISGYISGDISNFDTVRPIGTISLENITIQRANEHYYIDTIHVSAKQENNIEIMQLHSPFANAALTGNYTLPGISTTLGNLVKQYLDKDFTESYYTQNTNAKLNISLCVPDTLLPVIPGLKRLDSLQLVANINTSDSILFINSSIDKLKYNDYDIDSLYVDVNPATSKLNSDTLTFRAGFKKMASSSLQMADIQTKGFIYPGTAQGNITAEANRGIPSYSVDYTLSADSTSPSLHLDSSLIINEKKWQVNENNIIYFKNQNFKGSNVILSSNDESMQILSKENSEGDTSLSIIMKSFSLQNISNILDTTSKLAYGILNGNIEIRSFTPFVFDGHLTADSLYLKNIFIGNTTADVTASDSNTIKGNLAITGTNKGTLQAIYYPQQNEIQTQADITHIDLHSTESFLQPFFKNVQGSLQGNITASGNLASPQINGTLHILNAGMLYTQYATCIKIPDAYLHIDSNKLNFNQFVFTDSAGNKGLLSGSVIQTVNKETLCDVKLTTHNFTVIGKKLSPEQTVYGVTKINTNLSISGNVMTPEITGEVNVADSSQITYIYSDATDNSKRGAGLISFFNPLMTEQTKQTEEEMEDASDFEPVFNISVSLTPKTKTTIVLDELSGDQISMSGTSALFYGSNRNRQVTLTGTYTAESGEYNLSIGGAIRREFAIQKGSTIQWSGDLQKPSVDINAVYKVKTTAAELLSGSQNVSGIDNQRLDFEVNLSVQHNLLHPDISFKIDMPTTEQEVFNGLVYTRIKQVNTIPSELNKQVMSLLVLNSFVADNPFSSLTGNNGAFSTKLYGTAGSLLTHELTALLGNTIKWVDINVGFDINEDFSTGVTQRQANLKVNISKSLIHNRLFIYVGNSIVIDNHNHNNNPFAGLAGDVSGEYLLTADGRYRIKAYRVNENNFSFQGTIVKTGITFVMIIQFEFVRQLFRHSDKASD